MTQEHFFGDAKWVSAKSAESNSFLVLRGKFTADEGAKATLNLLGLGFFKCYINGACINPDTFLPLSSDFHSGCDPEGEILSGHRIYVTNFDISKFLNVGENVIAVHFGGGWYTMHRRVFGTPKAIYRISVVDRNGTRSFVSNESCRIGKSFIGSYSLCTHEEQDYTSAAVPFEFDFDDADWEYATLCEQIETEYCTTDCPQDALIKALTPKKTASSANKVIYDCGENTVGYPVLRVNAKYGEKVCVRFSEDALPDGELDGRHMHKQSFTVISDGSGAIVQPQFIWYGFRYIEVEGDAEVVAVKVVHANVQVSSSFECDNETLNWAYNTFVHTMLCNMHTGHPSDCPHIERRGYTGDGQLTCHASLLALDGKAFYEKWVQDIADCQDLVSGRIQYTAPYIQSGGGPGGWGCAIVEVPYQLYRHYGDRCVLEKYYQNMRKYIDYLESHSEYGFVTSDKEGYWCLGDWCSPIVLYPDKDISKSNQQTMIPAAFVNTYFMTKALERMCEIAAIIGKDEDIPEYREKAAYRKGAICAAYFHSFDNNFIMNAQGANAFALDIGLGNDITYRNTVEYYNKLGCFDTGIFATDILTRILFERGDAPLALKLLCADGERGFERWRKNGATTLHEYWDSNRSRSHNHPMFGAVIAYFFEYLLGIKQNADSCGYSALTIEPLLVSKFNFMRGSILVPNGKISVSYEKIDKNASFCIHIPQNTKATFKFCGNEYPLQEGDNIIKLPVEE